MQVLHDDIYSALVSGADLSSPVLESYSGSRWTAVRTASGFGMCMTVPGVDCLKFAQLNAFYNRGRDNYQPFDEHYTAGMDFSGKTVGVIGHMGEIRRRYGDAAKQIFVFELEPKDPEDLPAELEEELLPQCDIAVITGSALINGTLPHLLELCRGAYTVLTGPSVPMCPALLDFGIDRLAGMCVTDMDGMAEFITNNTRGNPFGYGEPFLIVR